MASVPDLDQLLRAAAFNAVTTLAAVRGDQVNGVGGGAFVGHVLQPRVLD
jgi:hypothetical protein